MKILFWPFLTLMFMSMSMTNVVLANSVDRLETLISNELSLWTEGPLDESVYKSKNLSSLTSFKAFELVAYATIGVGVPFLASLQVGPEIEIIWTRSDEE